MIPSFLFYMKIKKRAELARFFMELSFGLPKAVEIAIGVSGDECVGFGKREGNLGLAREIFLLTAFLGFDCYPTDIMLGEHGVKGRADGDFYGTVFIFRDNGKVLFGCRFSGVRNKLLHLFAAAYDRNAACFQIFNDIATMTALVKFHDVYLTI